MPSDRANVPLSHGRTAMEVSLNGPRLGQGAGRRHLVPPVVRPTPSAQERIVPAGETHVADLRLGAEPLWQSGFRCDVVPQIRVQKPGEPEQIRVPGLGGGGGG
jgi:hypothetical protein